MDIHNPTCLTEELSGIRSLVNVIATQRSPAFLPALRKTSLGNDIANTAASGPFEPLK